MSPRPDPILHALDTTIERLLPPSGSTWRADISSGGAPRAAVHPTARRQVGA